ncbi:MAG: NTP transferase domain-containing protein [Salinivirgaceae bacterium]|nr:NTP transferase domain-containing protein [Salinivirgaceae bacterium]
MTKQITGIVIAGGKSSRMGTNKALIEYKGKRLIDNAFSIIKPLVQEVIISSNVEIKGYEVYKDALTEIGPIGGLYTGLQNSTTEINLIIPCDVPNVTTEFYSSLLANSDGYDAIIPRLKDGKVEPLIGIYSKTILKTIEKQIYAKDYKLVNLLNLLHVKYVDVSDVSIFENINNLNDLKLPKWNNLLLVAGTDRNVGKTTFICNIIERISKTHPIIAIKITPHFHELEENLPVIHKSENLVIVQEINNTTGKDSSRMLDAGAEKVYYVQAKDDQLKKAIVILEALLPNDKPIICESAALRYSIEPGCFVVLSHSNKITKNKAMISFAQIHIKDYIYDPKMFSFVSGSWNINYD